jgi:hypothetical protein
MFQHKNVVCIQLDASLLSSRSDVLPYIPIFKGVAAQLSVPLNVSQMHFEVGFCFLTR